MADRTIRVTVVGDNRSLKAALKGSEASLKSLDATAAKSQQQLSKMEAGFAGFGKGAALAVGASAISAAFLQIVDSASRLQTAAAANQRIWGPQAAAMQEAAKAAADYGLAQSDYLQTSAKLGSQLRNLGMSQDAAATSAQSLMRMGENLAAVFGGDVPTAVSAISAALRGEFDPLEQYGIGITAAAVSARQSAEGISKAQAIIDIAMEQSTTTIGAAAAAQDTFAGRQRALAANFENAKAAVGEGFLPAASAAVGVLNTLAKAVTAVPEGLRSLAGTAIAAGVAIKGLQVLFGMAAAKTAAFAAAMAKSQGDFTATLGAYSVGKFSTALSKVGQAIPIVGAVVIALGEAYAFLDSKAKEAAISQEDLTRAVTGVGDASAIGSVADQIKQFGPAMAQSQERMGSFIGQIQVLGDTFLHWDTTSGMASTQQSIDNLNQSLAEFMAVNPAAGAAAARAAFQQLVAAGVPADQAARHLAGSLQMASDITAHLGQDVVQAAAQMQELTSAFDQASQAASSLSHTFDALFAGLDVGVAVQKFGEALRGLKDTAKGGFDATELQSLNQAWTAVSESMVRNNASVQELSAKYDQMRGATKNALAQVGISGKQAEGILNKIFGKRWQVKAAFKANVSPMVAAGKKADRALKQVGDRVRKPFRIMASWLGGGQTRRGKRDIDNVKQRSPARINADPSPAISAANTAAGALNAVTGTYTAVLNIFLNLGAGVETWWERMQSSFGGLQWYDWSYGDEDQDLFGPQMRSAQDFFALFGGAHGGGRGRNRHRTIQLTIDVQGNWNAAIIGLTKLEKIAAQVDKQGHPTAAARRARAIIKIRKKQLEQVKEYIKNAKVMFQGDAVGYGVLKRKLDAARQSMASLASELAEAINGVNIGDAWNTVTERRGDITDQMSELRDQLDEFRQAQAESFNPRVIDYYNQRIRQTQDEMARLSRERAGTTLRAQLQAQVARTREFYNQLQALRRTMSPEALAEIARQGPEAGVDIARELLADPQLRRTYNQAYGDAARFSKSIGVELAQDVYRPQINAITHAIDKLDDKIRRWLRKHHPEVRARIHFDKWVLPRARDLPRWVTDPPPHRMQVDQAVNVTVRGFVADPEGTARVIRRLLRDSANRNGNVEWARSR